MTSQTVWSVADMLDLQGIRTFGPYYLLSQIGMGGMAEVYLALRKCAADVRKPVALKCILGPYSNLPEFTNLFLHEARISLLVNHPNIIHAWDCVVIEGRHTMVMEYLNGMTLDKILAVLRSKRELLPLDMALSVGVQMLDALSYIHQLTDEFNQPLNTVHRDVSPQNICICFDGQCKIFDFGVARYGKTDLQKGMLVGKCAYMSPEQCHGLKFDSRSDLFALAAILYELTTGIPAFAREDDIQTLNALTSQPIIPPVQQIAGYPPSLSQIIMHGLERDPNRRYPNAMQFANDLRSCIRSLNHQLASSAQIATWMSLRFAKEKLERRQMLTQGIDATERMHNLPSQTQTDVADVINSGHTLTFTMQSLDVAVSKLTQPEPPSPPKLPPLPPPRK